MIYVVVACGGTFLVEQPVTSLLMKHDRLNYMVESWYGCINVTGLQYSFRACINLPAIHIHDVTYQCIK